MMKNVFVLLFLSLNFIVFSQNSKLFEEANTLYNNGQFEDAISKYEKILESGQHSAEVYFNLANAHYKLNHIAPSIYNYEKALLLAPNDSEIKNNRSFAQNMTIDGFSTVPKVGFARITNNLTNTLSTDGWAVFAVTGVVLFVIFYLLYYFSYTSSKKRIAFILSFVVALIALVALVMAFQKETLDANDKPAIVFADEIKMQADPNLKSDEILRIHEGTKVQIIDVYEAWNKIRLSNGTEGWIPAESIKKL
ncbi:tetratricopeptide repeat protein [Winogradskyella maritima]|uniref:Tetratricopeptide repeat protein n=1 Tax=Winogradskyella maritima TaxID=1517766 RepID=A0ABV8AIK0_9FLAO|nr:tetratricopeptide repeat protein [Winogradskyella maritima]